MPVHIRRLILASFCLLLAGCQDQAAEEESFSDMRDRLNAKIDEEYASRVSANNEEARGLLPAQSPEDLVKAFELAFAAGDFGAIEKMAYYEFTAEPEEQEKTRESLLTGFLAYRGADGEAHVKQSTIRELEEQDKKPWWTLTPVRIYEYETRDNDDSGGSNKSVPIVEVDGHYSFYLCLPNREDLLQEEE